MGAYRAMLREQSSPVRSTSRDPDLAARVVLDLIVDAEFVVQRIQEEHARLKELDESFPDIARNFLSTRKEQRLLDALANVVATTRIKRRNAEAEVSRQADRLFLASKTATLPEVVPIFQQKLTDFLHYSEGDPDFNTPDHWITLAILGEKYGEEIS